MELAMQVLVSLIAVMMSVLGGKSMFVPKSMIGNFAVEPQGGAGLNTIRGVIGGLFIGSVVMLVTGLISGETIGFLAVAVLLAGIVLGRLVGMLFDGFERSTLPPLVVEMVMIAILVVAYLQPGGV